MVKERQHVKGSGYLKDGTVKVVVDKNGLTTHGNKSSAVAEMVDHLATIEMA